MSLKLINQIIIFARCRSPFLLGFYDDLKSYNNRIVHHDILETDCISHSTNTLGEGMNPIILPPAVGK